MKRKAENTQCTHHWIIDSNNSETSNGKCKLCGKVKVFVNDWTMALAQFGKTPGGYKTAS